jgi:AcrR family transcriptional regulator
MGRPPRITREQIVDAARVTFTQKGFDGATLADIAAQLDVTAAALLRHFPSKQALFTEAMSTRNIGVPPYLEELAAADAAADPRIVLRRFAEQFVPFIVQMIRPAIAVQMHKASRQTTVVVPFDTQNEESPSRRGVNLVTEYFRRAMEAGVIRGREPRAMALLYISHLQAYVFLHHVLDVSPVYPLDKYLDALFDLWTEGAIVTGGSRAQKNRPRRGDSADRNGVARVHAPAAKTEAARPRRNAGGKDGERGLAGGRPRRPRPRR